VILKSFRSTHPSCPYASIIRILTANTGVLRPKSTLQYGVICGKFAVPYCDLVAVFVSPSFPKLGAPWNRGALLATQACVPVFPHDRARFVLNATLTNVLTLPSSAPSVVPPAFDVAPFDSVLHVSFKCLPHDRPTSSSGYPRPLNPATLEHTGVAALTATVFAGHVIQALVPVTRLYVPAGHAAQLAISPVYPTSHKHWVLPGTATEFTGHARHVLLAVASTAVEYVFTGHKVHVTILISLLYFPATHDAQSLRPDPPKPALHGQVAVLSNKICEPVAIASKSTAMSTSDTNF
jgi:hypothetical protein